jgi:hypothetical protein
MGDPSRLGDGTQGMSGHSKTCLLIIVMFAAGISGASNQMIVRHPDPASPLSDRWKWAEGEAQRRGFDKGHSIGYAIQRLMPTNSYIGSFYSDLRRNKPSLGE